ncbi:hypothetical protein HPB52_015200 [Rhipicephalus sanguineus]|uniref:Uncharacterized protein n=2 Tax=Rhipicephalus sanguineus TaxID=34632 RepID=A0A9D4PUB4_RHISA|nr:hypothetical protein HPB52_015200 [Rhipicephalus sanguineus]
MPESGRPARAFRTCNLLECHAVLAEPVGLETFTFTSELPSCCERKPAAPLDFKDYAAACASVNYRKSNSWNSLRLRDLAFSFVTQHARGSSRAAVQRIQHNLLCIIGFRYWYLLSAVPHSEMVVRVGLPQLDCLDLHYRGYTDECRAKRMTSL